MTEELRYCKNAIQSYQVNMNDEYKYLLRNYYNGVLFRSNIMFNKKEIRMLDTQFYNFQIIMG